MSALFISDAVECAIKGTDVYCPDCAEVLVNGFRFYKHFDCMFSGTQLDAVELQEAMCGKCSKIWLLLKPWYQGQSTPGHITAILVNSAES